MSKKPKKVEAEVEAEAEAEAEALVPVVEAAAAAEPSIDNMFDELITPQGNDQPKAAAFMSDDPNEVVKALQAALPEIKAEEPKAAVPAVAQAPQINEKTRLEMQRGVEVISKFR